jgi:hypothetical protein
MRGALKLLLVLGAAAVVGIVVGVIVLGGDDRASELTEEELALTRARVRVSGKLEPQTHMFGEQVTATLEAVFDPRRVRAGSVRVEPGFNPYEVVRETRTESAAGDLTRVRFEYVLQCLRPGCTPSRDKRQFDFPLTSIFYTLVGVGQSQETLQWPPFQVVSRLGAFDLDQPRWRAETRRVPDATFRASPLAIAVGLFAGAALLVGAAVALVAVARPRRAAEAEEVAEVRERTPLDRALELVEAHSRNGTSPEGRKALERLARELKQVGHEALAGKARRLAWSPAQRSNGDVTEFTRTVREAIARDATAAEETD